MSVTCTITYIYIHSKSDLSTLSVHGYLTLSRARTPAQLIDWGLGFYFGQARGVRGGSGPMHPCRSTNIMVLKHQNHLF